MRSSTAFLTAAAIASFAAASPLERRYRECTAPQQWHTCEDEWSGCCSVSPCKGPTKMERSGCPDGGSALEISPSSTTSYIVSVSSTTEYTSTTTPSTISVSSAVEGSSTTASTRSVCSVRGNHTTATKPSIVPITSTLANPPTATTTSSIVLVPSTPSSTSVPEVTVDMLWTEKCKEDDSNCNWNVTYYNIETSDETFASNTSLGTSQFFVHKNSKLGINLETIAVFRGIPDHAKNCRISSYKPPSGVYWGVNGDGTLNITTLAMGGKTFEEAIGGGPANYANTKSFITDLRNRGGLDMGNGRARMGYFDNSDPAFECPGNELVVHFSLAASAGTILFDQIKTSNQPLNTAVARSGWVVLHEE